MRRGTRALAIAVGITTVIAGCSSNTSEPAGLTDQQEANLLNTCLASASEPGGCAAWVDRVVTGMVAEGCTYSEIAQMVAYGLTPEYKRKGDLKLACWADSSTTTPAPN
jgi:nitrous oxide reductase accessory protein NosL